MTDDAEEYFKAYAEYSKVLRTWLVAYGIGGPILLLTNEMLAKAVKEAGGASGLAALFLAGVALQVLLAAFNKASMWVLYYGELDEEFKNTRRYRLSRWFGQQFWIDLAVDMACIACFILATWRAYCILVH